jgi:hypothetical protein
MDILIEDAKSKKEIRLGDVFVSSSNNNVYILTKVEVSGIEYPIVLASLSGEKRLDAFSSLSVAAESIEESDNLHHYSQDEWLLELKRK